MKLYDKQGNLMTLEEGARLFNDLDYRVIEQTEIGIYFVSTVWLGFDHNYWGGPPLIFETMVFWSGSAADLYMDRYATEEQAKLGHVRACSLVLAGLILPEVKELTRGEPCSVPAARPIRSLPTGKSEGRTILPRPRFPA